MKRALLVGVDDYDNFNSLNGCVNDANAVLPLLARNEDGSPNFNCESRTSDNDRIARDALLENCEALLAPGADVALFYFAGHGDERNQDVVLVTADGTTTTPGLALSEFLSKVQKSPVREVIVVLDCCFAGAAGGVPQLGSASSALRPGVSIIAASRGDQTAAETAEGRGAFSTFLCGGLEGGAADVLGKVTLAGLYAYLDESFGPWDQRPVFKANVDRLHDLRRCRPPVPLEELRRLPDLFPEPGYEFPLDPSYEPDAGPENEQNQAVFAILQHFRAAKLVEPIGTEHMYFAAMENRSCRLTPLGEHYRHMATEERL